MDIYTSEDILQADDLYKIQEDVCSFGLEIAYKMTDGELGWLDFARGRYSIADWIDERLIDDMLTFDYTFSEALHDDNGDCPFAACLSEDTALAKLFFWCYNEPETDLEDA